mmetsp:Transcript_23836/g.77518  ORF Transcript_23836/g.77518 Transcript_23836/m.77518 type:complete len:201 (+) Transcript_23836:533-1135(+)
MILMAKADQRCLTFGKCSRMAKRSCLWSCESSTKVIARTLYERNVLSRRSASSPSVWPIVKSPPRPAATPRWRMKSCAAGSPCEMIFSSGGYVCFVRSIATCMMKMLGADLKSGTWRVHVRFRCISTRPRSSGLICPSSSLWSETVFCELSYWKNSRSFLRSSMGTFWSVRKKLRSSMRCENKLRREERTVTALPTAPMM